MREKNRQADLRLGHGYRQEQREKCAGRDDGRPLDGENSRPEGICQKNAQAAVAVAGQPESQQRRADSPEKSGGNFGGKTQKRQRKETRGERILLQRSVVGILALQHVPRETQGPAEISGVLMEMHHEKPAEDSAGQSDRRRDCDAPSHGRVWDRSFLFCFDRFYFDQL